jgi:hypothetical protein
MLSSAEIYGSAISNFNKTSVTSPVLFQWVSDVFYQRLIDMDVKLNTWHILVPTLTMCGATPPHPAAEDVTINTTEGQILSKD